METVGLYYMVLSSFLIRFVYNKKGLQYLCCKYNKLYLILKINFLGQIKKFLCYCIFRGCLNLSVAGDKALLYPPAWIWILYSNNKQCSSVHCKCQFRKPWIIHLSEDSVWRECNTLWNQAERWVRMVISVWFGSIKNMFIMACIIAVELFLVVLIKWKIEYKHTWYVVFMIFVKCTDSMKKFKEQRSQDFSFKKYRKPRICWIA